MGEIRADTAASPKRIQQSRVGDKHEETTTLDDVAWGVCPCALRMASIGVGAKCACGASADSSQRHRAGTCNASARCCCCTEGTRANLRLGAQPQRSRAGQAPADAAWQQFAGMARSALRKGTLHDRPWPRGGGAGAIRWRNLAAAPQQSDHSAWRPAVFGGARRGCAVLSAERHHQAQGKANWPSGATLYRV